MKLSELQAGSYETPENDQSPGFAANAVNNLGNIGVGLGYRVIKDLTNLGTLPLKGMGYLAEKTGNKTFQKAYPRIKGEIPSIVDVPEIQQRAETGAGKVGQLGGVMAEYLMPTGAINRGSATLSALSKHAPKGFQYISKLLAKMTPEAAADFAVEYGRTGGDTEEAKKSAMWGAGTVGTLNILGDAVRASFFPELKDSMAKALGTGGKSPAGKVAPNLDKQVSGFATLKEMAPKTKIIGLDGVEKTFDPHNASYFDTIQALSANKKQLFDSYSRLAKTVGDNATIDLTGVVTGLDDTINSARTTDVKNAARQIMAEIYENFGSTLDDGSRTVKGANIENLQTYLQDLNSSAALTFAGKSDKAHGEVAAKAASQIRELMEDVISTKSGEGYQALRTSYASLKSIEDDLVKRFKQEARKLGGGLTDYMYLINTPEIISSIATMNPAQLAGSLGTAGLAGLRKYLLNPDRFLRRTFDLVEGKGAQGLSLRLFGGTNNTPLSATEKKIAGYIKNIKPGLTIDDVSKNAIQTGVKAVDNTPVGIIDRHLQEAQDVMKETPDFVKTNLDDFLKNVKTNIVDGLKRDGFTKEAAKANIELGKIKTLEMLTPAIDSLKKNLKTGKIAVETLLGGAAVGAGAVGGKAAMDSEKTITVEGEKSQAPAEVSDIPMAKILDAMATKESSNNPRAVGDKDMTDKAHGTFQIRKPALDDVNKELGNKYPKNPKELSPDQNREVAEVYLSQVLPKLLGKLLANRGMMDYKPTQRDIINAYNYGAQRYVNDVIIPGNQEKFGYFNELSKLIKK